MSDSLYEIPQGCICMGDGLFGMVCTASTHARLKQDKDQRIAELESQLKRYREALEKLSAWPPSYPATENIERMRKFAERALKEGK